MLCCQTNPSIQDQEIPIPKPYPVKLNQKTVCIIGCTYAGTTAAIQLRTLDPSVRIIVFETNKTIAFINSGIHLAISKACPDMQRLFYNSPETFEKLGIEVHVATKVDNFNFGSKFINTVSQTTMERVQYQYDKAIIATGSMQNVPSIIEGIDYEFDSLAQVRSNFQRILMCKSYADAQRLTNLKNARKILIVGAGHIGMELAQSYQSIGIHVTVLDHNELVLGKYFDVEYMQILQSECESLGIKLWMKSRIIKMLETESFVQFTAERIIESQIKTVQTEADYVILAAGFKPNTINILNNSDQTLKNANNVILVNRKQQTNIQNVYAIGDCCTTFYPLTQKQIYIPLASQAVRQAVIAAYQAAGINMMHPGCNWTYGIQILDYSLAATGLSQQQAMQFYKNVGRVIYSDHLWNAYCDKKIEKVVQNSELNKHFNIHGEMVRNLADQIVESMELEVEQDEDSIVSIILIYDQDTFKLLGSQVMGKQDITQLVNAMSIALQYNMTLQDIAFSNFAGFEGETKMWGILQTAAASVICNLPDFEDI
ncbi:NADH_oxidase [Hexamita inflata]|uniref:NADH oxidase n=1 Tax=Hexamita inflata TaxID=28002 RepID=A0AA86UHA1_9EUKA|nr:NADH oxidase [Hexamita inflata]